MAKNDRIWEYVTALSATKDRSVLSDPDFDKIYQPFLVNRSLSAHEDSVLAAQIVNERWEVMPPKAQCLFLLNTLRARRRFGQWLKHSDQDDVVAVAEYYHVSLRRARELVSLHTSDQLLTVHRRIDKGGGTTKVRAHGTSQ